jgi:hypothetical protein
MHIIHTHIGTWVGTHSLEEGKAFSFVDTDLEHVRNTLGTHVGKIYSLEKGKALGFVDTDLYM